jgi:DNA-directed RNA polymerase specialized sigma24 family protein
LDVVEQRTWTNEEFGALYERFFAPLFDVAVRVLGSDEEAGNAVGPAFSHAFGELERRRVDEFRPWLYGLLAADLLRRRASPPREPSRFAQLDRDRLADPERLGPDAPAAHDVWAAASSLPKEDYLLLDLQLRQGLRDRELAHALDLDLRVVQRRLERLRDRLEGAVESPVSPVAVFAALARVAAPPGLKERVWTSVAEKPARRRKGTRIVPPRKPVVLAGAIALFAAAATAGAFYAVRGEDVHDPTAVHSTSHSVEKGSANPEVEIAWTPSPDASGYSVSWSAEPVTPDKSVDLPGAATGTTGHLEPGTSWFNLRTRGTNGHWTSTVHVGPFLILPDTVVPETTITAGPKKYGTTSATFEFESNEKNATLECSLDRAAFEKCGSPKTYPGLTPGEHSFRVRAVDSAGNTDPTPAHRDWRVDSKAPTTSLTESPDDFSRVDARFEFRSSERHSSFECKLDDEEFTRCSSPKIYGDLKDGKHRFHVRAIDRAGNRDRSPAQRKWTLDTKPPETAIDSGPARVSHKGSATFTVSSEAEATFECRLDRKPWGECGEVSGLEDGKHVMRARAKDRAGNVDRSPASWKWKIDLPPETKITAGPSGRTASKSATFRFSSTDADATFQCKVDGGDWAACTSGTTYSGLTQGSHTFSVRAKDAGGTKDRSPAERRWTVDTVAPNTTITSGPKASTKSKSAMFSFSASESGARFECRLDKGDWRGCSSSKTYSGLKKGTHVFHVRAVDKAGNRDGSPDAWSWTIH